MILRECRKSLAYGLFLFFLSLIIGFFSPVWAEDESAPVRADTSTFARGQEIVQSALQGLKSVVELWSSQEFSGLYEWGTAESRHLFSKEQFIRLMKDSSRQLQCCWVTLQDLKGFLRSPTQVYVQAKLGYLNFQSASEDARIDSQANKSEPDRWVISSTFDPRTFLMVLQQNHWRIDLAEVLIASGYLPESLGYSIGSLP